LHACIARGQLIAASVAAEHFEYPVAWDVRSVISVEDTAEALGLGPNGGLVYCMEFVMANLDVLDEALGNFEEDFVFFDCPGQIELYTHIPVMRQFIAHLQSLDYNVCAIYCLDAQFMGSVRPARGCVPVRVRVTDPAGAPCADDPAKFCSGVLSAVSVMINLEVSVAPCATRSLSSSRLLMHAGRCRTSMSSPKWIWCATQSSGARLTGWFLAAPPCFNSSALIAPAGQLSEPRP
jgi:hypothetical protein